jgi:hypothetical protein
VSDITIMIEHSAGGFMATAFDACGQIGRCTAPTKEKAIVKAIRGAEEFLGMECTALVNDITESL